MPDDLQAREDALAQALRDRGLKLTRQRLEVIREVAGTDEHPDVESIYRGVRVRVPNISLDTVYRTLGTLEESGLVSRVSMTPGPARYDANTGEHHHFVCTRCGLVRDVPHSQVSTAMAPAEASLLGSVDAVEVQFRGVCRKCSG